MGSSMRANRVIVILLFFVVVGLWTNVFVLLFYGDVLVAQVSERVVSAVEEKGVTAEITGTVYCTTGNVTIVKGPSVDGSQDMEAMS